VVGLVAELKGNYDGKNALRSGVFVADQPRSPVSEAFRALRTNLEFSSVDSPLKTILVSSSGEGEGKTTVASNLAIILSQGGKKVLLLDADLRRPNVHKQFSIPNRVGLSDLIRGRMDVEDVIQVPENIKKLSIITSGSLPPNPAELLGSLKMGLILDSLKSIFDVIVIDTPPMLVSDAQILSSRVDGILFVVRPGKTHIDVAKSPLEELKRIDARVVGVVLNRIPRNRGYYYGGYRYYSPYYSSNGYHYTETLSPGSLGKMGNKGGNLKDSVLPTDDDIVDGR
jgi:capsular exopolysaccharide synthesis family protein